MKKNGTKIFTLVIFLLALAALGYYTYLTNNSPTHQDVKSSSEKERLLNYDMENDYPKTVRETVKLHCRYLKCLYNSDFAEDEFTEDELFVANQQIRKLLDAELLEHNSPDSHLQGLKDEIQLYKSNKQKIVSYTLAEASQIEYNTENGQEYAKMRVTMALNINGASISVDEEYILRQDEVGKWKILGWQAIKQDKTVEKGE